DPGYADAHARRDLPVRPPVPGQLEDPDLDRGPEVPPRALGFRGPAVAGDQPGVPRRRPPVVARPAGAAEPRRARRRPAPPALRLGHPPTLPPRLNFWR